MSSAELSRTDRQATHRLTEGTARIFAAEALLIPTGLLTAAYLSRRFGPEEYGLLTVASVLVVWVESNVAAALSRPAIKLVSEATDWHAVGSAVLRLYLLTGCALGLVLWALSAPLAALTAERELADYLRPLALGVPLFCVAQAHRNILVGLGRFRERAFVGATRWVARLVLVVAFAALSESPVGAVWGSVCATLVELVVCRCYARPRVFQRGAYSMRRLCGYALPLVAAALCMSLFGRLDLLLLNPLGATAGESGLYAVAQNLALLPSLFSFAFAPALLSTLSRRLCDGDSRGALQTGRQAMRAVLLLLPVVAIIAGAAPDLILLIFGQEFLPAAPLMRVLIIAALALLMTTVTTSILTAAGKPAWTLHVAWPSLACALAGHFALIPAAGPPGAAIVTAVVAIAGAIVTVGLVHNLWHISPPARTLWRCAIVCAPAYAMTAALPAAGLALAVKLAAAGLFVLTALLLLGEFSAAEIGRASAILRRRVKPVIAAQG